MNNRSYQQIFDQFNVMFPEFKKDLDGWFKSIFNKENRGIVIRLKNGCYIFFGTIRDENNNWIWVAYLDMSNETKRKLEAKMEE